MLTLDLVRARRRGASLEIVPLNRATRARATELAEQYIAVVKAHVGQTRGELEGTLAAIPSTARDRKIAGGLRKLLHDRCEFEVEAGTDPAALRREVFQQASTGRLALAPGERFEPRAVLERVARERSITADELERLVYVDLRSAHRLLAFAAISGEALVELYELGQAQAVLLRAVRVTARVFCASPGVYRALFHRLKFLRLLYTVERIGESGGESQGGYQIAIDGPYSMFRSVTKYGLQLAMLLPALRTCDRWSLEAEIQWGKAKTPLQFAISSAAEEPRAVLESTGLSDEVCNLLERFRAYRDAGKTAWQARPATEIFSLPGTGVCVPDLAFKHPETGVCVYLEVMGFWSRKAVWKRVELVERGLPQQVLFAVSSRLRVSEAALDTDVPSALYVYKGTMSPKIIARKLDELATRKG